MMILFNTRANLLKYSFNYLRASNPRILLNTTSNQLDRLDSFGTSCSLLFSTRNNRSVHYLNENLKKTLKIAAVFLTGTLTYILYHTYQSSKESSDEISLDLNHIYEKCATMFLSNPELIEAIGLPIKITSSESDLVREIHLRRQGNDLFSFISYRLQGSQNSGTVYCKLRMFNDSHKFQAEEIFLKLDKKFKNKREILIKSSSNRISKNDT